MSQLIRFLVYRARRPARRARTPATRADARARRVARTAHPAALGRAPYGLDSTGRPSATHEASRPSDRARG